MELWQVLLEGHERATTIYIAGLLTDLAAARAEKLIATIGGSPHVVRLDLRAVEVIDPVAFVVVARALNQWRERTRGQLAIQFPARSPRSRRPPLYLLDQPSASGIAVSTAMSCPINTSPG
ncbi:MAG: hypothetical protein JWM41_4517 [Gemmatimonadetes bacterium]|nr:hypothetical protein [Gemmatimonadota bacterium]